MTTKRSAVTRRLLEGLTDEEWRGVRTARANVLFIGRGVSAKRVVEALQSHISDPIQVWRSGARLVLPPVGTGGNIDLAGRLARWRTTISATCTIGCRSPPAAHV